MKKGLFMALLTILSLNVLMAEDWITIHNDDLSLVRNGFDLDLLQGRQEYNLDDITSRIMPASVIVRGEGIRMQNRIMSMIWQGNIESWQNIWIKKCKL